MLTRSRFAVGAILALHLVTACGAPSNASDEAELTLFAAASLREVVSELAERFEAERGTPVVLNFAGSNTLAQQVRAAPGADLYLSADEDWVRFLEARGRVVPGTVRPFMRNRLVVIARPDAALAGAPWNDLSPLGGAGFEHLVLADPGAVPAGRYARQHLERADPDLWRRVSPTVIPTLDVRAALQMVASDPRHLGIVYRTDALTSGEVEVLYELPELGDVPIVYWSAVLTGGAGRAAAERFMGDLAGEEAAAIIERHGFLPAR